MEETTEGREIADGGADAAKGGWTPQELDRFKGFAGMFAVAMIMLGLADAVPFLVYGMYSIVLWTTESGIAFDAALAAKMVTCSIGMGFSAGGTYVALKAGAIADALAKERRYAALPAATRSPALPPATDEELDAIAADIYGHRELDEAFRQLEASMLSREAAVE